MAANADLVLFHGDFQRYRFSCLLGETGTPDLRTAQIWFTVKDKSTASGSLIAKGANVTGLTGITVPNLTPWNVAEVSVLPDDCNAIPRGPVLYLPYDVQVQQSGDAGPLTYFYGTVKVISDVTW